jgi:parvulin-like peptidyl-prolyl isomerase
MLLIAFCAVAGAADAPPAQTASQTQAPIVARVGEAHVTLDQLQRPLMEGYGLNVLLNLVQLEIAKQNTAKAGITVTADDIARERAQTIENMFKDSNQKVTDKINDLLNKNQSAEADKLREQMKKDNEQAFGQFLENQHYTRAEFDIVVETNAHLRKLAEPQLKGKIDDEKLKEAFNALYGENVKCRHIQANNVLVINEAKRRIAAGEPFEKVAAEVSENASTGPLGGELPPFSLQTPGFPEKFKEVAFALKEGEVSEMVQAEGAYHIIKLEKRIAPKAVKFEDVKESLRADLQKKALEAAVKELRIQTSEQAVRGLMINDPVLKAQWDQRLAKRDGELKERKAIREQQERERNRAATTQPLQ